MVAKVVAGVALALAMVVLLIVGDGLGWDLDGYMVLGAGVGAVLALVPDRSPLARLGGFLLGVLAAALGYALRAAVLPDSTTGRALALVIVIALAVGLVLLTFDRVPLWTAFLGIGALGGAYEEAFTDSPGSFLSTLPATASSFLLVVAAAFAATVFFAPSAAEEVERPPGRRRRPPGGSADQTVEPEATASLDEVLSGQERN